MTDKTLDYDQFSRDALRQVVRRALDFAAKEGLSGEHHFYISFQTAAPGVEISHRLHDQYPHEMTIVLQHQFWGLLVGDDQFEVQLSFSGNQEKLVIPYSAIKLFFDPATPFGLQFDAENPEIDAHETALSEGWLITKDTDDKADTAADKGEQEPAPVSQLETAPKKAKKTASKSETKKKTKDEGEQKVKDGEDDGSAQIVSLDSFRKK